MKKVLTIAACLILVAVILGFTLTDSKNGSYAFQYVQTDRSLELYLDNCKMVLTPLDKEAVRVQCLDESASLPKLEELIYTERALNPKPIVTGKKLETGNSGKSLAKGGVITMQAGPDGMKVKYDARKDMLTFYDDDGHRILEEIPGSRSIVMGKTGSLNSLAVSQSFKTEPDEFLFGTGQFQDGYLNIKGLTRRLTQVNTQIAVPMVISNKGYGILWNNYGLTDFNPSESIVELQQGSGQGQEVTVNATGTAGNVRERRSFNDFNGTFTVSKAGDYSILLDVGQTMARKHLVVIDGDTVIEANNTWLPPTSSAIVKLSAGEHKVMVSGSRGDKPSIGLRMVNNETTFSSPVAVALDYTVFEGDADDVMDTYRNLTGRVPEMPEWAFGYIHCRERYNTQEELLQNAREFRSRNIPIDVIVQDWQWWGKYGWNAMQFDEDRYPDPAAMTAELDRLDMHLMLSVWSKIDKNSTVGREMNAQGYYIQGTDWIDFFNPDAAATYWKNFSSRLLPTGVDAWWQDATEPENDDLKGRMIANGTIPGEFYRNIYPNMVNNTVANGLKQDKPEKQMILTRSAFSGMQRYGAVTWSGDVGNDWETLKRQIAGGLGQMAAGLPWWTYDAGGFFRPNNQYTDAEYHERMLRWIETSVFLPFMRVHGYMSQTEPWRYPEQVQKVFVEQIKLRYKLLPYVLECARKVSTDNYTMMRPLVFDYPEDKEALKQQTEYMFGPALLICPVTAPGVTSWRCYLPKEDDGWYDFHTGKRYRGGQYVEVPVSIDYIPVFVKGDSKIAMAPEIKSSNELKNVRITYQEYDKD